MRLIGLNTAGIDRDQWRVFWAVFLGWVVDAFDFNMLIFILIDIQRSFSIDRALAGALGTVTLLTRLLGSAVTGVLADKYGRKLPLMLSVVWFSLFACLSGFSTSYAMLFALRALFGLGMAGEWTAGMPLLLEHWPARARGLASGLLQGGWYWGYLLAAAVFQYLYPLLSAHGDIAWRVMLWSGIVPALLTLWMRRNVKESPVWLERRRQLLEASRGGAAAPTPAAAQPPISLLRILQQDLIGTTLHTAVVIGACMAIYYSINYWYPTLLREARLPTLPYLTGVTVGSILGCALWGALSQTRIGRRGAITLAALGAVAAVPLYLDTREPLVMALGALAMGLCGNGIWGTVPAYTAERFPTAVRGVGPGFCYHCGSGIGALVPWLLGTLQDHGLPISTAIARVMIVAAALLLVLLWLGPETRGREFTAGSDEPTRSAAHA